LITFSIVATDTDGAAVFSWVEHAQAGTDLIKSLDVLSDEELPHAITRFSFEYVENIFISTDWWENLTGKSKQALIMRSLTEMRPDIKRIPNCLKDDGLRITTWSVIGRHTSVNLI
jgi:hypothetical protein